MERLTAQDLSMVWPKDFDVSSSGCSSPYRCTGSSPGRPGATWTGRWSCRCRSVSPTPVDVFVEGARRSLDTLAQSVLAPA